MFWSKSHIHSLDQMQRNEAVNLPDDQTAAGEKTFSDTTSHPGRPCGQPAEAACLPRTTPTQRLALDQDDFGKLYDLTSDSGITIAFDARTTCRSRGQRSWGCGRQALMPFGSVVPLKRGEYVTELMARAVSKGRTIINHCQAWFKQGHYHGMAIRV